MKYFYIVFAYLLCQFHNSFACDDSRGMSNFNENQLAGYWNVIYTTGGYPGCVTYTFILHNNDTITEVWTMRYAPTIRESYFSRLDYVGSNTEATFYVDNLSGTTSSSSTLEIVVDTDYNTYAIIYRCYPDGSESIDILSRTPENADAIFQQVLPQAIALGAVESDFVKMDNTNCPTSPTGLDKKRIDLYAKLTK